MPVKKTPDGRIIEEKTKAVGFTGGDKTQIVGGGQSGASADRTVLSSRGQSGGGLQGGNPGIDALDDKTKLVGRGGATEAPGRGHLNSNQSAGGRNHHLGGTKPIGSPTGGGLASNTRHATDLGSPKTKLVRAGATEAPLVETETDDPVAGWLVVEKGPGKGRSIVLGMGMNTVGRGQNARARLNFGDDTLSSEKHFLISYDPRSSHFAIHLGDSANLTYLNSTPVYGTQPLNNYDVIEAGETQLRFVSFCGEHFTWDD